MMKSTVLAALIALTACSSDERAPTPDAAPAPIVVDPAGRYALHSTWRVTPPPATADAIAQLTAATDGPDDPSRFLIDHMIARLDDGWPKTIATAISPYLAAYVNQRIDEVAPNLVPGIHALGAGLDRISRQFETEEMLVIDGSAGPERRAQRTITAVRFNSAPIAIAPLPVETRAGLDGEQLTIAKHVLHLPHGELVLTGFTRAVIPSVVPGVTDLAHALIALVDCNRLGALVAERVGVGAPSLYARACRIGVVAAAAEIEERLAGIADATLVLELGGVARGLDRDRNGSMDAIIDGTWSGTAASAVFDGTAR